MALTRVSRHIIDEPFNPTTVSATDVTTTNINASGIGTVGTLRVTGDLTVEGTTTTLDSILTEVDRLEVSANSTVAAGIITQTGSGDILQLYDGSTEVFTVQDGGNIGIGSGTPGASLDIAKTTPVIRFTDTDGGQYAELLNSGSSFYISADRGNGGNGDIIFRSGGTSEKVRIKSNGALGIGTNNPGQELHVQAGTGLESDIRISGNGGASSYLDLFHNATNCGIWNAGNTDLLFGTSGTERLRITSDGKVRVPDGGKFVVGDGDDLEISRDSSNTLIENNTGSLYLFNYADDKDIILSSDNGSGGTNTYIMCDGSENSTKLYAAGAIKLQTISTGVTVNGNITPTGYIQIDDSSSGGNLYIGNSSDLKLFHNGTNNHIRSGASNAPILFDNNSGVLGAKFVPAGAFELYHNGNKKFETTSTGVTVTGSVTTSGTGGGSATLGSHLDLGDNQQARLGAGDDLKIYHDGSVNRIRSDVLTIIEKNDSEDMASFMPDGAVVLFHDGSQKLETTTTGAKVTGALEVTQEYPSIRPTLDLNFAATKTLDRRITFTRDSLGTYTDDMGIIKYASNNVPRFDHDFGTGESLGLLIEESRTNLLSYSTSFNLWSSVSLMSVSVNNQTAPDGTQTAANFIFPTNPATIPYCTQLYTYSAAAHTFSVFAKYNGIQYLWLNMWDGGISRRAIFDIQNGTLGSTQNSPSGQTITAYGNGWYRCTISATTGAGSGDVSIRFANSSSDFDSDTITGNGSDGQYIWGAQLEQGAFPTSYIPTSGSTVTRAADLAKITGTNFTDFYNQTESTIFCNFTQNASQSEASGNERVYRFRAVGGNDSRIDYVTYNAYHPYIASDGSEVANLTGFTNLYGGLENRTSVRVKKDDFASALNGTVESTDTSGAWPPTNSITEVNIGSQGNSQGNSNYLNGHIRQFSYYNKALPDAQLQGLTQQ